MLVNLVSIYRCCHIFGNWQVKKADKYNGCIGVIKSHTLVNTVNLDLNTYVCVSHAISLSFGVK